MFVDALAGGVLVYAGGDVDRPVAFVQVPESPPSCVNWSKSDWIQ